MEDSAERIDGAVSERPLQLNTENGLLVLRAIAAITRIPPNTHAFGSSCFRKSCTESPISHGAARMIFPRVR